MPLPSSSLRSRPRLSSDIGGTFTDIVLEHGPRRWSRKVLTTHGAPEQGLLRGVGETLRDADVEPGDIGWFVHGMTLATNAILERSGARTALLTTEGFRDVLEIGDEGRFDPSDLRLVKQRPLIPRELRFTVRERAAASGEVLLPLDESAVVEIAGHLTRHRIESLAIGFLHAYANPEHERRARDLIRRHCPALSISLSSDVCPEIREYERISTVAANAYVQPLVVDYLDRLTASLREIGLSCPILVMTSGGGLMPLPLAKAVPIRLVESGPAGGAILSASIAADLGEPRILSFDMGGTTAKICFITDATPQIAHLFEVDRAARFKKGSGLPLRIPVVELVEIGAGGGSIASVDVLGRIAVGPRSAGSEPGPACYANGGEHPTVTDADLMLGKIDPDRFAGGTIRLDQRRAESAIIAHLGTNLTMPAVDAAYGIVEMVDEMMANAARVHASELGKELAQHTLVAFGGAAPLHAARVAEKLGIAKAIVPRGAGVGSALGFLRAPLAYDVVVSRPVRLDAYRPESIDDLLRVMRAQARDALGARDAGGEVVTTTTADMRYVGQGYEIAVPFETEQPGAAELRDGFEKLYATLFGRTIPNAPIEVLSWQVRAAIETWQPADDSPPARPGPVAIARPVGERAVFDGEEAGFRGYAVYRRDDLAHGDRLTGPALIIEDETTTVVTASFAAHVDGRGHIVMERVAPAGDTT
jgi:N-methylhydantoinase A